MDPDQMAWPGKQLIGSGSTMFSKKHKSIKVTNKSHIKNVLCKIELIGTYHHIATVHSDLHHGKCVMLATSLNTSTTRFFHISFVSV